MDAIVAAGETSQDPIEIRAENEITIPAALAIAHEASLSLGLSTLQRWAKLWATQGPEARVKTILVTTRQGKLYKIDRDDFAAWVFDQKQNARPQEVPADLERSRETSQDPVRPRDTSRDPKRPDETSQDSGTADRLRDLESENMNLKIDIGVRKQLLDRARDEMENLRSMTNSLLRENGALQFQIQQLAAPHASPALHEAQTNNAPPVAGDYRPGGVDNRQSTPGQML